MPTVHSQRLNRSRWAHVNTPDGLRRRRATADAKREAMAAALPPTAEAPAPLAHWQRIVVDLYVPTAGRCDQHAAVIDGECVGLMSATQIGVMVRGRVRGRPSVSLLATMQQGYTERDEADAMRGGA